jgi:hypothetical protein
MPPKVMLTNDEQADAFSYDSNAEVLTVSRPKAQVYLGYPASDETVELLGLAEWRNAGLAEDGEG